MPLHLPDGSQSYAEYEDLADRIVNGDGIMWQGDPYMSLHVGVVTDRRTGRVAGHRLEVHRWCEDGEVRRIGSWHPSEQFRIPMDLARMRADQPGGSQVQADIDKHNAEIQAKADQRAFDAKAEMVERLAYQFAFGTQGNPRNRFSIDKNPLAKD